MATIKEHFIKSRTKNMQASSESAARTNIEPNAKQKSRMAKMQAKKKQKTKKILIRSAIAAGVIILCFVGFFITFGIFNDVPVDKTKTERYEIIITEDMSKDDIGYMLKELGCIADVGMFKTRCLIYDAEFIPGTYKVSPSFTTEKIINILSGYDYSDGTMDENDTVATTAPETTTEAPTEAPVEENQEDQAEEEYYDEEG